MAIVINPDGTVSTIETTHDQYGNIKPKIDYSELREEIPHSASSTSNYHTFKSKKEWKQAKAATNKSKRKKGTYRAVFNTVSEIDAFFQKRRENDRSVYFIEFSNLMELTPSSLQPYLKKKYFEYRDIMEYSKLKKPMKPKERDKVLKKVKANIDARKKTKQQNMFLKEQNKDLKEQKRHGVTRNTIGDIATFGSLSSTSSNKDDNTERKQILKSLRSPVLEKVKERERQEMKSAIQAHKVNASAVKPHIEPSKPKYASSQDFDVRTSNPPRPARPPKYAYARDRYGRVQERDSFNEEKKNEFYVAQNRQRNYDYSSYDSNDDNDGAYSDWE